MPYSEKEWSSHLEDGNALLDKCYEDLHRIWSECGYDEEICHHRRDAVISHLKCLLNDMVSEEERHKNHLITKVEEALKELTSLGKELRCNIPTSDFENFPLNKLEKALRNTVEQHRILKQERLEKLNQLREKERQLCRSMGIEPLAASSHVPTDAELDTFQQYLNKRDDEKAQLQRVFKDKQREIRALVKELEWVPSLEFEKIVVQDDASFVFSQANMEELECLHNQLEKDLQERKLLIMELHAKLTELWDRLGQDIEYRDRFLFSCRGYGVKVVAKIKEEISRLEEIKRQNVKKFVEYTRRELEEWWSRCHFSEQQKEQFIPFHSDCFTEDLLELHELEVQKVKQYYEANINIFQLVKQRQSLWDKMLDIENRTHDKNRLFANRGGQLLQEERERKQIQKALPKIEATLLKYLKEYKETHGTPFILNGEVLADVIGKQWEEHQHCKDQEKLARKKMRDQESAVESRFGARSLTKDSTGKRKRCETPNRTPHSVKRLNLSPSRTIASSSTARRGKILKPHEDPARIRKAVRKSLRLNRQSPKPSTSSSGDDVLARELSIASTALSYTRFEGQLELLNIGSECRSSVKPKATPTKPSRRALTPRNFGTPLPPAHQFQTPRPANTQGKTPATSRLTTPRVKLPIIF